MPPSGRLAGDGAESESASAPPFARSDERFPAAHRLRRREDFLRVQREGTRVHTPHFVLVVLPHAERPHPERSSPGGDPASGDAGLRRLGITVTKKVAGAVGRNRVKRVVREVFRRNRDLFPERCDVVVIGKSGAHELGYEEAKAELAKVRGPLASAARKGRRGRARREER